MSEVPPPARTSRALVAVVALLLATQWLLFAAYVRREIAWAYAPHSDQTMSLNAAYRTYEDVRHQGVAAGLGEALRRSPPSGALLHLEAALVFLGAGPSRLAALGVNWLHFALLQAALVAALWATSRRWELPVLGLGLLWSVSAPFYWAGGLADFRPDFVAFCLYGTFLAAVWRSDLFRRQGWSIAAGGIGTLCVLSRSLTSVYLAGVLGGAFAVLGLRWLRERDPEQRAERRRQLNGVVLCSACLGLTALPLLAVQARTLWNYYVVGHVTGPERAVRAASMGFRGLADALGFYPRSVLFDQAGWLFSSLSVAALAVLLLARRAGKSAEPPQGRGTAWFFALALLLPLAVLTADTAKSPLVGSLLVTPLVWLVLAGCAHLQEGAAPSARRVLAVGVLASGAAWQAVHLLGPAPPTLPVEAVREALRLHDDLARWSVAQGWSSPVLLADRQRDYVPAIRVSAYERHGRLLRVEQALGRTVWRPSTEEVLEPLRRSDFVILTRPQEKARYGYPYDEAMSALYPRLRAYCRRHMVLVGTYNVPEEVSLFARRPAGDETDAPESLDAVR